MKDEQNLYTALQKIFEGSPKRAFDCHALYDMPSIREVAASASRVSDYLGNMWRKGQLLRTAAPKNEDSRSRWLYQWKSVPKRTPHPAEFVAADLGQRLLSKPTMEITDRGDTVVIELLNLTITITAKNR